MNSVGTGVVSPSEESPPVIALRLLRSARYGVLATLTSSDGSPYASRVAVAPDARGEPVLLLSRLAWHTRNLLHDARASLLVEAEGPSEIDPLAAARVSLLGRVEPAIAEEVANFYLSVHPEAAAFAKFNDFKFFKLATSQAHLIAGFGRIETFSAETLYAASN